MESAASTVDSRPHPEDPAATPANGTSTAPQESATETVSRAALAEDGGSSSSTSGVDSRQPSLRTGAAFGLEAVPEIEANQPQALPRLSGRSSQSGSRGGSRWNRAINHLLIQFGLRARGPRGAQVQYPPQFKALVVVILGISASWVGNYLINVQPTIEDNRDKSCKYNDNQLTYNAKMLFVYFLWFAMARMSLFLPCVATRVAVVQSRTHGFCRTYCVHLVIRDGPLYIFVVGSLLFWFHLMQSPNCQERSPELYHTLKLYAIYSCMVSVLCLLLAYWHNKLLFEAAREPTDLGRSAPPDTINQLETVIYDKQLFGDEESKSYPSECPICLMTWEAEDLIKVTPCQHAFHEECIGNWLQTARTCALCRQDLTKRPDLSRPELEPNTAMYGAPVVQEPLHSV